ncbi:MAG: hypothetical protein ACH34Y_06220, partial [Brachymonas sp.]
KQDEIVRKPYCCKKCKSIKPRNFKINNKDKKIVTICPDCKEAYVPSARELQSLGISGVDASLRWHDEGMDSRLRGNDEAAEYKLLDFVIAGLTRNLSFFSYQKSELLRQVFRPKKPIWLVKINPHPAISLAGEGNTEIPACAGMTNIPTLHEKNPQHPGRQSQRNRHPHHARRAGAGYAHRGHLRARRPPGAAPLQGR